MEENFRDLRKFLDDIDDNVNGAIRQLENIECDVEDKKERIQDIHDELDKDKYIKEQAEYSKGKEEGLKLALDILEDED